MIKLIRVSEIESATLGILLIDDIPKFTTLEPAWTGNTPNESCIPVGEYGCMKKYSFKFGHTFEVMGVPGRSAILFHSGNYAPHTSGCILLGSSAGRLHGLPAVLGSKKAMKRFREEMKGQRGFRLLIIKAW